MLSIFISKPIKQTKPMVNLDINNKQKTYHNQDIPIPKPARPIRRTMPVRPIRPTTPVRPKPTTMAVRANRLPKQGLKDERKNCQSISNNI